MIVSTPQTAPCILVISLRHSIKAKRDMLTAYWMCRALNAYIQPSMATSGQGKAAAPKGVSGHACTGNERRLVAGISSFAFQVTFHVLAMPQASLSQELQPIRTLFLRVDMQFLARCPVYVRAGILIIIG